MPDLITLACLIAPVAVLLAAGAVALRLTARWIAEWTIRDVVQLMED